MVTGIILGLCCGLSLSCSYVFSRRFVVRRPTSTTRLLVVTHAIMGAFALALLPFAWQSNIPGLRAWMGPLLWAACFYLAGQLSLFMMMKYTEASRISPLLSLKILTLAILSVAIFGETLSGLQWIAIGLCVFSAIALTVTGGTVDYRALLWLGVACLMYSGSDLNITRLIKNLAPLPPLQAAILGTCMTYSVCGVTACLFMPFSGGIGERSDWTLGLPFAVCWLLGMFFLFACFSYVGTVFGAILQSTRGIWSVLIGAGLAACGHAHLETRLPVHLLIRRILAAVLMCLAIWLYSTGY